MSKRAWVTLATNDSYGLGALVLVHSLRRVGSVYPAVVLITPSVTDAMRERLRAVFAEVVEVNVLDSKDSAHLALLQRPELGITFTKIHCWSLTQYEKCVFLDADALVVQNSDELFEREELSAAPDVGWPDCFNSGVFVYRPSQETFNAIIGFAKLHGSFDGGDQGLLNQFFSDWSSADIAKHLPFLYNVTSAAFYSYLPALKYFGHSLKIIHFIGSMKPWLQPYNWETHSIEGAGHLRDTLQLWWSIFVNSVHPKLDGAMVGSQAASLPPPLDAHYYEPEVNPHSEFPWHHKEPQPLVQGEEEKPKLDINEFFNPWDRYGGNIPLKDEHSPRTDNSNGRVEITQDLRDYIWEQKQTEEYYAPITSHDWHPPPHVQHSHHEDHQRHHESFHGHQHHDHGHHESHHQHHAHQPHHEHREHQHHNQQHHHHHHQEHRVQGQGQWGSHAHKEEHGNQVTYYEHSLQQPNTHKSHKEQYEHRVEQIHHVQMDSGDKGNKLQENKKRWNRIDWCDEHGMMNGYLFGDECEDYRPRHPYDGFYLRHKPAIDSSGKKVCSHQLPPTPPPTPPLESPPPPDSLSNSESNQEYEDAVDSQTGVAGNLARVVASSYHGDAIDELTRRQGWEAGNIDYMGADSFDNIWAKISQTLSQPPASGEQEQPSANQTVPEKQASPPKEQAAPVKPPSPPKQEVAPVKQPSPPKQVAAPVKQSSPPGQAVPVQQPSPPKEPAPVKQPSPPKQAAPVKASSPPKEQSAPATPVKTEPPAVPKTPPVTPKTTPEATTPVTETPTEDCPTPEKSLDLSASATDSPPLANTPAKEEASPPETKTEGERSPRGKPAGKLLLLAPAVADPLPTPDSELEDADSLAQSIIAGELATPTITQPTPPAPLTPASPATAATKQLSVEQPSLDTPPAGPVSLAQIGVKPKGKPTTAAQIASSVPETPPTRAKPGDAPKKVVKKVAKVAATGPGGEAPVPPPRKKEKKPKDK